VKAAAAIAGVLACLATFAHAGDLKALVGGRLVDGAGGAPLADSVILIDGDRISAIGQVGTLAVPAGAEVIPTEGLTVLPGLWDLQVRLARLGHGDSRHWDESYLPIAERVVMPAAARQLLLAGVTSVRDVGSPFEAALSVRDRIRDGRIPGPTLWVSGPALQHEPLTAGYGSGWSVQGAADARQKAERLAHAGVDLLLVAGVADLADPELEAIAAVSRATGIAWYAEVRRDADVGRALAQGAAGLVGFGTDLASTLPDDALAALKARAARAEAVPWTAGVSALTNYEWLRYNATPLDEGRWREGLPAIIADDIRASLRDLPSLQAFDTPALRRPVVGPRLRSARAAGARLLVGSDAGVPAHLPARATWQEIEALVLEGGLTPLEAIRAATLDAAATMGAQHEAGSVSPGKFADLIVVRGDPLRHIERLQDVEIVIRHGLRYR
jgi:imidazolonepropionase-like amidohydrolase